MKKNKKIIYIFRDVFGKPFFITSDFDVMKKEQSKLNTLGVQFGLVETQNKVLVTLDNGVEGEFMNSYKDEAYGKSICLWNPITENVFSAGQEDIEKIKI